MTKRSGFKPGELDALLAEGERSGKPLERPGGVQGTERALQTREKPVEETSLEERSSSQFGAVISAPISRKSLSHSSIID